MLYLNPDVTPPCNQAGFCPETNFDPHQAWTHQIASSFAETSRPGSDVAGTDSLRADYANIKVRPIDGGWQDANGWQGFNSRFCYYHQGNTDVAVHFVTWTEPLNHGTSC